MFLTFLSQVKVNALIKRASLFIQQCKDPRNDPALSLKDFATAVEIDPSNPDVYHHRSNFNYFIKSLLAIYYLIMWFSWKNSEIWCENVRDESLESIYLFFSLILCSPFAHIFFFIAFFYHLYFSGFSGDVIASYVLGKVLKSFYWFSY